VVILKSSAVHITAAGYGGIKKNVMHKEYTLDWLQLKIFLVINFSRENYILFSDIIAFCKKVMLSVVLLKQVSRVNCIARA